MKKGNRCDGEKEQRKTAFDGLITPRSAFGEILCSNQLFNDDMATNRFGGEEE